jgi:hypothetical protein
VSYVDGEADGTVKAHIEQCPFCREKADRWGGIQKNMRRQLYRHNCPSPMKLGEYQLGLLPASQKSVVSQHLRECPVCRREVVQLGEFLEEPTSRPDIIQSARVFIAKLISGGGTDQEQAGSSISPAFAGLRGEEDEPFIYQVGNVQIVIDIQDDVEQIGHKTILGLVTGSESKEFIVQVSQEDQIIATSSVDEIGNFVITQLMPGDYEIVLEDSEGEIHIQSIQVI